MLDSRLLVVDSRAEEVVFLQKVDQFSRLVPFLHPIDHQLDCKRIGIKIRLYN